MALSDILAAMLDPTSQEGYQQGSNMGANPKTPLAQAMAQANLAPYGYGGQSAMPPPGSQGPQSVGNLAPYGYGGGTPVQQAMQQPQQAPQGPPTQMQQAMAPQDQQAPQQPMSPIQQQFNNQASNPNLALGMGALAAGGAMLQGKNFGDGFGAAASAFGPAYQNTLNMQRDLNTPKVTQLADGAFSSVQMPGGQPQIVANGGVQDYIRSKMAAQFGYDTLKQNQVKQGQIEVQSAALDAKQGVTAQSNLQTLAQSQQGLQQAQQLNEQLKADPSRLTALQVFSKLSPAMQKIAVMTGNAQSVQAQTDLQTRNNALLDGGKLEITGLNGGSDEVIKKGFAAVPPVDADPANWDSYFQRSAPLLQERIGFYNDVVNRGLGAGNRSADVRGPNDRPVVQNTLGPQGGSGATPGIQQATAANWASAASGALFQTPDGRYVRKP